jgi:hypothetical protein
VLWISELVLFREAIQHEYERLKIRDGPLLPGKVASLPHSKELGTKDNVDDAQGERKSNKKNDSASHQLQ